MKRLLPLLLLALCLTGCRTAAPPLDYRALVRAADRLGMDIGPKDHHALYLEAAEWLGTPYRSGGQSRRGTDCSGFVRQVYKAAYGIDLPRSTDQQVDATRRVRPAAGSCARATWSSSTDGRSGASATWAST